MTNGPPVKPVAGGFEVAVVVSAGARRSGVTGVYGDALKVSVRAAPERGKANEEVVELLAGHYGVRASEVRVVAGATSRRKRVQVMGAVVPRRPPSL